jgi:hypothetical protein
MVLVRGVVTDSAHECSFALSLTNTVMIMRAEITAEDSVW